MYVKVVKAISKLTNYSVWIDIVGTHGSTGDLHLGKKWHNDFERGHHDHFEFAAKSVGESQNKIKELTNYECPDFDLILICELNYRSNIL